ncbi:PREDICTED: aryl hydrocarbon receptor nuclear translocator-like protein 1 isoform X1 [Nicrophorus vespilloides]|uniref:Aryl hydrocarbon receptor nuclear translocator-like protein 1 isoform X1 n=2 Tax=Nicrophorus vespilloides TaxID=110193 RepID=A0ABM1MXI0_NICVS|nr:PREDICTED: aryl hydrocarbon receptor nuclear translocator-like protein 1 isoform X1 [Nicrophorus vespilloides]
MYNSYTNDHSDNCSCYSIMNPSHWYNAPIPVSQYNFIVDTPPSNSREMRNKAEKMRRDKLNSYISELACLVPLISKSPKRMDKTSILRLTATHLRIYQTLLNGNSERMDMPRHFDQMVLENLVYEQLRGFLLILTGNGKVVFVSHTVENILGHAQTDLMGQSIFNITAQEDHDRFRMYITSDSIPEREWRKYFNIRLRRAGPRSESPVYESVNVMGMQRMTSINQTQSSQDSSSSNSRDVSSQSVSNEMWVFFVRLYRPEPISDQLVEASKEEYVTRHLVDGKIINCDQRISFIAGYMIEEVSGECAFSFMHRDDVRFVMIALRQSEFTADT